MNRTSGFTLAELLMAISLTAVIGVAAATLAGGLSNSCAHQDDYRQSVQDAAGALREIRSVVSKAQLIPAVAGTSFSAWTDANADMVMTLSEMVLIRYDSTARQLLETRLVYPATWTLLQIAALDTVVSMSVAKDLAALLARLTGDARATTTVLAEDVMAFSVTAPNSGTNNNHVDVSITVGTGARQFTLRSTVSLRASLIGKV